MKILFLDTRPIRRGAQVFVDDLKRELAGRGFEARRIFLYREDQYERLSLDATDEVLPFGDKSFFERVPTVQPSLVRALMTRITAFQPDIILCNGSRTLKYAAAVKRLKPGLKAKWVYRVIDSATYWNKASFSLFYYRWWVIPAMDAAVGASRKSLDEMVFHYRFRKPGQCIPRAVNMEHLAAFEAGTDLRAEMGFKKNAFVILFLGNFTSQKRPDRFLEILARLKDRVENIQAVMVGDGPLRSNIEASIREYGLGNIVTLAGYQKDVRPWLSIANVLLLCSDTEGMPGVVLEAAAMKVPSVSGNVGGVAEFIENGTNGFLVNDRADVEAFVQSLIRLANDPILRTGMGAAAEIKLRENYEIQKITDRYIAFFNSLSI